MKLCPTIILFITLTQANRYKVTDQVFFDIEHDGKYLGRIIIGLFGHNLPRTVANFKTIASNGINGRNYESTIFHRVIERFIIQGGDIIYNNGSGSASIYGDFFEDESFEVKHSCPGIISMANGGPNTNGCQFFITTMAAPWLDGNHVAFGKVVKGQDVVHKIEHVKTYSDYVPVRDVKIIRSGVLTVEKEYYESNDPYEITLWTWIKAGWLPLSFSFAILGFFHWLMTKLNTVKY